MDEIQPFDDFRRLELRIGTVVEVNDHPEAEKLYILKVDVGEEEPRTVVTNIKSFYPYDKMMGRKLLLDPSVDVPNGTLMSCGMETKGLRCEMKHLEKVTIKVAQVKDGKFLGMDIDLPEGAPTRVAAVIDGDRAIVLGDGNGCVMTVDGEITDGAPAL